ncbi:NAD+ synthase (glutamine-hydrolysing) [Fibrobacter sp. UWT3]|uniref:NAD(+) synthase n=1 Tax=Fibrobacter sp. UWT3 TaxID=1896225 RepID=UPI000BC59433|nr:NAD(+) synthase [Fibrobacter sp. UWT3]SOE47922.1 NAD+ synthase (glutamine-hydrolysing) [Fibrobacter sp. UWT3]
MFGFYRFACVSPVLKVADTAYNTEEIIRSAKIAASNGAAFVVFPELCITGYTCSDLFHQELLLLNSTRSLVRIADALKESDAVIAVGLPLRIFGRLYNCAAFVQHGRVVAITPKIHLPNQREFYEKRHFSSGRDLLRGSCGISAGNSAGAVTCFIEGAGEVPVTNFITVKGSGSEVRIGVELCEDLWTPAPPSGELALAGANVIVNLSASDALVGKCDYRRNLVMNQSARCMAAYVYASAGVHESTTDMVFSGHLMIAENGSMLAESKPFSRETEIVYADVDVERLNMQRLSEGSFQDFDSRAIIARAATLDCLRGCNTLLYRYVSPTPFVPGNTETRDTSCTEIFNIQCAGLAKRLEATRSKRAVIGLSGGLDSTLALLVVAETFKLLNRPAKEILALTMPGFGTTHRTRNNAVELAKLLGVELRTIDIQKACLQHFADIGHDPQKLDVTYENVQARERTQILMDIANSEGGIVIGTGDLSEIALGWSTYNADHMSMYAVNCDIPKTLVRHIVNWYADRAVRNPSEFGTHLAPSETGAHLETREKGAELAAVLRDILDTPVSPELLPADSSGQIAQKTESILGAYELHDFFLYHFAKYGASPEKLRYLAKYAFANKHTDEEIYKALAIFIRRFFTQQFKRSCIPDGPKVGTISLSPRADWRMPSDASFGDWLKEI